jgi:hypothetical protein
MAPMLCVGLLAMAGRIVLPTDAFTLAWVHTVERTPWEEDYAIHGGQLSIRQARVKRSGAGMDPGPGAIWSDGWWKYVPSLSVLPKIALANSAEAPGYTICWQGTCQALKSLVGSGVVTIAPLPCPVVP